MRQNEKAETLAKVIERFHDRVSRPVLTDLAVDWNGLDAEELSPAFVPDLFAGQPLLLHARYGKAGSAPVTIKGKMLGKPWRMTVNVALPEKEAANAVQGPLWARSRITDLERLNLGAESADNREKIIALALEHKLVTRFTSYVAVDESPSDGNKDPLLAPVEAELPEGTRYEGFFGGNAAVSGYTGAKFASATGGRYAPPGYSGRGAYSQPKFLGSGGATYSPDFFSSGRVSSELNKTAEAAGAGPVDQAPPAARRDLRAALALGLLAAAVFLGTRFRRRRGSRPA